MTIQTIFNWNFQSIATSTAESFAAEYLRKERGDLNEVASDNDDDANSKDNEDVENSTGEALTTLDRLVNMR